MNVFVYESTCAGSCPLAFEEPSLLREGRAMLLAILQDVLNIFSPFDSLVIQTIWDSRCGSLPFAINRRLTTLTPQRDQSEIELYRKCCTSNDVTLIVAPEFDNILYDRCEIAARSGARVLNCDVDTIQFCSDKLRLNEHLQSRSVHVIPAVSRSSLPDDVDRFVVKPRFGAGSIGISVCAKDEILNHDVDPETRIVQPLIFGRAYSIGVLFSRTGQILAQLPVAEQHLSKDGHFTYQGGSIGTSDVSHDDVSNLVRQVAREVTGLRGYVGIDFVVPDGDDQPLLVEINPRVTTSYVGYRSALSRNIMELLIRDETDTPVLERSVSFTPDGQIQYL